MSLYSHFLALVSSRSADSGSMQQTQSKQIREERARDIITLPDDDTFDPISTALQRMERRMPGALASVFNKKSHQFRERLLRSACEGVTTLLPQNFLDIVKKSRDGPQVATANREKMASENLTNRPFFGLYYKMERRANFLNDAVPGDVVFVRILKSTLQYKIGSLQVKLLGWYSKDGPVILWDHDFTGCVAINEAQMRVIEKARVYDVMCCEILTTDRLKSDGYVDLTTLKKKSSLPLGLLEEGDPGLARANTTFKIDAESKNLPIYWETLQQSSELEEDAVLVKIRDGLGLPAGIVSSFAAERPESYRVAAFSEKQDSDVVNQLYEQGLKCMTDRAFDEAKQCFQKAVELDPKHVDSYVGLGVLHQENGEEPEALETMHKAYALNPDHPQVPKFLAAILVSLAKKFIVEENIPDSIEFLQKAIEVDPDCEAAVLELQNLKKYLEKSGFGKSGAKEPTKNSVKSKESNSRPEKRKRDSRSRSRERKRKKSSSSSSSGSSWNSKSRSRSPTRRKIRSRSTSKSRTGKRRRVSRSISRSRDRTKRRHSRSRSRSKARGRSRSRSYNRSRRSRSGSRRPSRKVNSPPRRLVPKNDHQLHQTWDKENEELALATQPAVSGAAQTTSSLRTLDNEPDQALKAMWLHWRLVCQNRKRRFAVPFVQWMHACIVARVSVDHTIGSLFEVNFKFIEPSLLFRMLYPDDRSMDWLLDTPKVHSRLASLQNLSISELKAKAMASAHAVYGTNIGTYAEMATRPPAAPVLAQPRPALSLNPPVMFNVPPPSIVHPYRPPAQTSEPWRRAPTLITHVPVIEERRKQEEEAKRKRELEEAKRKREQEDARRKKEQEDARKKKEQEDARRRKEQEDARKKKEQEDARRKRECEARRRKEEEKSAQKEAEEKQRKKQLLDNLDSGEIEDFMNSLLGVFAEEPVEERQKEEQKEEVAAVMAKESVEVIPDLPQETQNFTSGTINDCVLEKVVTNGASESRTSPLQEDVVSSNNGDSPEGDRKKTNSDIDSKSAQHFEGESKEVEAKETCEPEEIQAPAVVREFGEVEDIMKLLEQSAATVASFVKK